MYFMWFLPLELSVTLKGQNIIIINIIKHYLSTVLEIGQIPSPSPILWAGIQTVNTRKLLRSGWLAWLAHHTAVHCAVHWLYWE